MNFNQYVQDMLSKSLNKPKRVKVLGRTSTELPHEPAALSQGLTKDLAKGNNERAVAEPATGEVVGLDPATGEALVRQPGNRVVRVQAEGATAGNTVSVASSRSSLGVVKKSGSVTSTANVTGKGWQQVEGRPGVSRLTGSSSRQIEGLDQLADPCVPPDVKLQLVLAENARGVGITAQGVVGFTQSGTGLVLNNQASRDTQAYIDQLYAEVKAQKNQAQSLPQQLSLDPQGGTSTLGQQFSATQASLWKCVDGNCVQAADGIFATKEQCQVNCGPRTYSCVNGTCVEIPGPTGQFKTLGDCINNGCNTRYTCIDGQPVPSKTGEYATFEDAIAGGCFWGYDCDGFGNCTPTIGGAFKSLACCQLGCVGVSEGVVLTAFSQASGAPSDSGAYFTINGLSTPRDFTSDDGNNVTTDAKAVNLFNPVSVMGDLRNFDEEGDPDGPPGPLAQSCLWFLTPEVKRQTITVSSVQIRYPVTGLAATPPANDAELDTLLGNLKWAQYVIQPAKVVGPIQTLFRYQAESGFNPDTTYRGQLSYSVSPLTLIGNHNLYKEKDWDSSATFQVGATNNIGASTGSFGYVPTTWFSKYTSWFLDTSSTPNEIVVNYPDTTWVDPLDDIQPEPGNFWANPDNVTYANSPVIAPGVVPSPLYKHNSGKSLFHAENWGVDFRGVVIPLGNAVVYPTIPGGVTIPPDYQAPGSPGTSQGYCFYTPQRYFFNVTMTAGDPLPTFLGEPSLPPVTRVVTERKALLNTEEWTTYNASAAETEDYVS